ncbi:hypothetical protein F7U68_003544, partial [Vibrio metschnikovii]|nr:hypothetical protein [Vibrio metschnikovii]
FIETQLWMYSSFAASSMAYFLALFSAGENVSTSYVLMLATILFSISLIFNASMAFFIVSVQKDGELIHLLNISKYFRTVPMISIYSFVLGLVLLVGYFSIFAALAVIISVPFVMWLFFKSMSVIKEEMWVKHRKKMAQMDKEYEQFLASLKDSEQDS